MDNYGNEMASLLTTQEIMDAIQFVNEGGKEEDLAQIVTYSKRMVFIAVNTHVSSREIAEQYEGFSSFISIPRASKNICGLKSKTGLPLKYLPSKL